MSRRPVVFQGSEAYEAPATRPAITIGNFDGVHLGHRSLILEARRQVGPGGIVCAYTFSPTSRDVFRPNHGVPAIQSLEDKIRTLGEAGVDQVIVEAFTPEYGAQTPRWFCEHVLAGRLNAAAVVVGSDFKFGKNRAGNVGVMKSLLDVPVVGVPSVAIEGAVVSSTRIRALVEQGRLRAAARLLARPHEVVGEVVRGDARGRRIGFPTANVRPSTELLPKAGVYAVRVQLGDRWANAVANFGDRPTFRPGDGKLEIHVLDWDGDLYGQTLRVAMVKRIRDEQKFDGVEALKAQIQRDVETARMILVRTR